MSAERASLTRWRLTSRAARGAAAGVCCDGAQQMGWKKLTFYEPIVDQGGF